jgi:hypothetical protein
MPTEATMRILRAVLLSLVAVVLGVSSTVAADDPSGMFTPDSIQWGPAPPSLPPGSKLAVLYGDPAGTGLFVLRAQLPPNYQIAPHWHPTDELITVLSGTFKVGMGDQFDASKLATCPAGCLVVAPARMSHFVTTTEETVIEVSAMGPFELTYVNPADDPSKK